MKKILFAVFFLFSYLLSSNAQDDKYILGFKDLNQKFATIDFRLINNLIIIPIFINNSDTLFFILDTGINPTLLTTNELDLSFKIGRVSQITGLGKGENLEVLQTYGNTINIGNDVILTKQNVFVVREDRFELSKKMGTRIDGIIGGVIFTNFIVEINYDTEKIKLINPEQYKKRKYKRWLEKPIELYNNKPYINLNIALNEDTTIYANLLFDLGASDALWLMQKSNDSIIYSSPDELFYLGQGINGDIYGAYDKIKSISFSEKIKFEDVQICLPDTNSLKMPQNYDIKGRNGTLGSEIIKRFNVVIDYKHQQILLKKNSMFNSAYSIDYSGLEIDSPFENLNIYEVYYVQKNSPAEEAGLIKGDIIMKINNILVLEYTANEMNMIFSSRKGRVLKIEYNRDGINYKTKLKLRDYRFE